MTWSKLSSTVDLLSGAVGGADATVGTAVENLLEQVVALEVLLDGYWIEQRTDDMWIHHGRRPHLRAVKRIESGDDLVPVLLAVIADAIAQRIMAPPPGDDEAGR